MVKTDTMENVAFILKKVVGLRLNKPLVSLIFLTEGGINWVTIRRLLTPAFLFRNNERVPPVWPFTVCSAVI